MKSKLHTFLAKHGAINKFKRAMEHSDCMPNYTLDEAYIAGDMDSDVLQSSFWWEKSVEGHKYWEELDDKYQSAFKS